MHLLISIAAIVLVLTILVFVHEFGHYAAAKLFGVRVEVFSLGFGKRLWGFRRGDTDYRVSALPLGGYVKMSGENPMESRTGDPGEFTSHPRWQRFLIAIAGPAMNVLLAIVTLTGVFMFHYERPAYLDQPAVIGWIAPDSPAQKAGLQPGDRIVRIQNIDNPTWEKAIYRIVLNPKEPVEVDVRRGSELLHKSVTPREAGNEQLGEAGWLPWGSAVVSKVEPGLPAAKAGIQAGDELLSVNGVSVSTGNAVALSKVLEANKDQTVQVSLLHQGQPRTVSLTPEYIEDKDRPGNRRYRIGVEIPQVTRVEKLPFSTALNYAVTECKTDSGLVFELLGKVLRRKASVKGFSSPVGMAKAAGDAAMEGLIPLLGFMALVSLQLALFNLLPIPILDGGLMLMLLIEGTLRRDIRQEIKERVYQAAFVFLLMFAAVVIFNDVLKQFHPS